MIEFFGRVFFPFILVFNLVATVGHGQEICNNGLDDDGDSLIDYNDPDCSNLNQGSIFYERGFAAKVSSVSDLIQELSDLDSESQFFDMLIKYYEYDEELEKKYGNPDNIDHPGTQKSGDFSLNQLDPFKLYPNPNNGSFSIEFFGKYGQLRILDTRGMVVKEIKELYVGKYNLDVSEYPKGMYFVEIFTENTSFKRRMVVD